MTTLNQVKKAKKSDYKYEVGQEVFYTNEYGTSLGNRVITGREVWKGENYETNRYYISLTDTPWFPVAEQQLKPI